MTGEENYPLVIELLSGNGGFYKTVRKRIGLPEEAEELGSRSDSIG